MNPETLLAAMRTDAPPTVLEGALLGTGLAEGYAEYESPIGAVIVAFNPAGVTAVDLAEDAAFERVATRLGRDLVAARPPAGWDRRIGAAIERGRPGDLPLDLRALTDFQRDVLAQAAGIPRGEVRTYGWLARESGHPRAVRAVGSAMARNPVPLIVPCHRVVRSDGRIGAYSLGGPDRKWTLLRAEGAHPDELETLAARGVRFVGSDTTSIYCHPSCARARRIGESHRVAFRDARAAEEAGFRPCLVCRP
jgi:O-6-methylguanine DNA methyltransferase